MTVLRFGDNIAFSQRILGDEATKAKNKNATSTLRE
jgi:hypothetical protein